MLANAKPLKGLYKVPNLLSTLNLNSIKTIPNTFDSFIFKAQLDLIISIKLDFSFKKKGFLDFLLLSKEHEHDSRLCETDSN